MQLYVTLMAAEEPGKVYKYLSQTQDYPLDDCLELCRRYGITDAEAHILERTGDNSGALKLTLDMVRKCLDQLKTRLRNARLHDLSSIGVLPPANHSNSEGTLMKNSAPVKSALARNALVQMKEGVALQRHLQVAIEVCERSTTRGSDEQALWFLMLDRLVGMKSLLHLNQELPQHQTILEAVLTEMIQRTLDKMSAFVPLPRIVRKITDDHSGMELGELRDILLSMLDTYTYETNIYRTAVSLVATDLRRLCKRRQRLKCSGVSIRHIEPAHIESAAVSSRTSRGGLLLVGPDTIPLSESSRKIVVHAAKKGIASWDDHAHGGGGMSKPPDDLIGRSPRHTMRMRSAGLCWVSIRDSSEESLRRVGQVNLLNKAPAGLPYQNRSTFQLRSPGALPQNAKFSNGTVPY
uniref:Uncharacterized protein n=2 Tax=Octactis speculum TaxID=3111310 RepID=A0A7S2GWX7_9STRA|mmetsp:Transcript_58894/g.80392  ORF Transcript_58894/g.80392 Transcript_58894/m.80392 type:complete len:408 (+) Transcript_58894:34-1257(+)